MKDASILLVDDEKAFVDTMAKRLSKRDLNISKVYSGEDALDEIKNNPETEVVVLDIMMPGIDGIETLRRLKKDYPLLEVIILTGHGRVASYKEAEKLGAFSYLEKPYDIDELIEVIKQAYHKRLKNRFKHDKKRQQELDVLLMGSSPMGILKSLMELDQETK